MHSHTAILSTVFYVTWFLLCSVKSLRIHACRFEIENMLYPWHKLVHLWSTFVIWRRGERLQIIEFSDKRARRRWWEDPSEQQLQEDYVQCAGADRLLSRTDAINIYYIVYLLNLYILFIVLRKIKRMSSVSNLGNWITLLHQQKV